MTIPNDDATIQKFQPIGVRLAADLTEHAANGRNVEQVLKDAVSKTANTDEAAVVLYVALTTMAVAVIQPITEEVEKEVAVLGWSMRKLLQFKAAGIRAMASTLGREN